MLILLIVFFLIIFMCFYKLNENYYVLSMCRRIKAIDGMRLEDKVYVVQGKIKSFGNNFDLLKLNAETVFAYCRRNTILSNGKSYLLYFFGMPVYNITNAEDAAALFQSTEVLNKSIIYNFMRMFLGDGLLITTGRKWHARRKLLTPAFHFNVLKSFNEVFKEESLKLLKKLHHLGEEETINLNDLMTELSLNSVIETALGVKLDDISGSAEYRKIIHEIELIILERIFNPALQTDWVFRWFGNWQKHKRDVGIAHKFSSKIIEKKRQEYQQKRVQKESGEEKRDDFGKKKRYAMLDTLLDEEALGNIDHAGICEEVDTFMFEGYDTTSTCLIFAILSLALHADVQEKCRQEVENLGEFSSLTVFDFNKLDYLECILKETLRLYPSVPFFGRTCITKTQMNDLILPKTTNIHVHVFDIMRDPKHFPDPNAFKPERFFPENSKQRHPFAFVPFSAGSRNCIGQKFAILEMKAVLVAILKSFRIIPVTQLEDLILENGFIIRTQQKIFVKLKKIL